MVSWRDKLGVNTCLDKNAYSDRKRKSSDVMGKISQGIKGLESNRDKVGRGEGFVKVFRVRTRLTRLGR